MKSFKKLALLFVLAIAITSCKKDDDNNSSSSLVGSWKLTAEKVNNIPNQLDACDLKSTLKFTETKVTSIHYDGEDCMEVDSETFTYSRNGNTITVIGDEGAMDVEITKLTSSTLEIKQTELDENMVYTQTYTKQ